MNLRQAAPLLFLVLLPAAGGVLSAQEDRFERRDESPEVGHVPDEPQSEPDPAPSEPPPDSSGASPESPSETPAEPPSETPEEPPSETPGRYAVPVTELPEPHRQPPSRDRRDPRSSGGDGDGYIEEEPVELYDEWPEDAPGGDRGQAVLGGLDLDLSPGRTQVYLNGQYWGIVDQYDGWPSFLLLNEGVYDLVFYLDGFRTLARRVTIYPGTLIKMNDRLEPGLSIPPEELMYQEITSGE